MLNRIMRAIRLDRTLYREVADNPAYMNEAIIIIVAVSLIASIGTINGGIGAYIAQVFNSLLFGWVLWAVVAYFVGTKFFQGRSSIPEMLRVLAYANLPRLLGLFGFIPCIGPLLVFAGWVLSIIAAVIAIRELMEFDTTKAVITALIGVAVFIIVSLVVLFLMGAANLVLGR